MVGLSAVALLAVLAQERDAAAAVVFRRYADHVVKVEISERGSGAKAELGSAFFVTARGHLVTNYHVIAKLIHDPDRYRAELVHGAGVRTSVTVLAVDVVHDLAVLASNARAPRHFPLTTVTLAQGRRLYALGHPRDLGLAIVEGTYNGRLQHTLYERIHFTGSLNPGMSGGPAITAAGVVVGVNVATAGNQVSFLVPVERAAALVREAAAPGYAPPRDFLEALGRQVRAYQDAYVRSLFSDSVPTVELGSYRVPTQPAGFFRCWADADRDDDSPYEVVEHACSTDDFIYLTRDHSSGLVEFEHRLLTSERLNRFRFAALYTAQYRAGGVGLAGREDDVTSFRCRTRNVQNGGLTFKTVLCVRRYRKFEGLYDAVLRAATLGRAHQGLLTTLTLSGVSFENALLLSRRYLENLSWIE
jgi:S1-C subfamily serine protease